MKIAVIWFTLSALCSAENAALEAKLQDGLRARQNGSIEKALTEFREAVALDPGSASARMLLGSALLETGKIAAAVRELDRAVKLAPDSAQAHFQLAVAQQRSGDQFAAVAQLRRAAELDSSNDEYAYQLGRAYLQLSEWSVDRIKAVDPKSARLYQVLGESYGAQGKTDLAIEAFTKAAAAAPQLSGTHLALAMIYAQSGRNDEALREIDREIELAPESAAALAFKRQLSQSK